MSKIKDTFSGIQMFFQEVAGEVKKTSWPGRSELFESTVVVIVSLVMIGVFIGVSDKILSTILRFLIPVG